MKDYVKLGIIAILILALGAALVSRSRHVAEAKVYKAQADELSVVVDSLVHETETKVQVVEKVDTLYVERVRAQEMELQERAEKAETLVADLRVRLDEVGDSLLASYVEERDARDAIYLERIDLLSERVRARDDLIASLHETVMFQAKEIDVLRASNMSLSKALSPSIFTSIFDSWETHAVVAGLGFLGGRLIR